MNFAPHTIVESLNDSLSRLCSARVDIFLMHEISAADVTTALADVLQDCKDKGVVGSVGVGSSRAAAREIALSEPRIADVTQFAWNALDAEDVDSQGAFTITHGALEPALSYLNQRLEYDRATSAQWSSVLGLDLKEPGILADLLLAAAISANSHGLVLVHSHRRERIQRFARIEEDETWLAKGTHFRSLVTRASRDAGAMI